jgi:predicted Fe-S protein YdhL (DUF1289 family)
MSKSVIKSPCISVCVLDNQDVCEGCYRSANEITDWSLMSDEEKMETLKKAKERFQSSNKNTLL